MKKISEYDEVEHENNRKIRKINLCITKYGGCWQHEDMMLTMNFRWLYTKQAAIHLLQEKNRHHFLMLKPFDFDSLTVAASAIIDS